MSHVNAISLEILDMEAAALAAKELGGTLVKQSTYAWWGTYVGDAPLPEGFKVEDLGKCAYAIKVPGTKWEIGLAKAKGQDHYTLLFDYFGSSGAVLEKFLGGKEGNKFKHAYAKHTAILEARRQGWTVQTINKKNGGTRLVLTGM